MKLWINYSGKLWFCALQRKYCSTRSHRTIVAFSCIWMSPIDLNAWYQGIKSVVIVDSISPRACVPLLCHSRISTLCGKIFTVAWIQDLKLWFLARGVAEIPWHHGNLFFLFFILSLSTVGGMRYAPHCPITWSGTVLTHYFVNFLMHIFFFHDNSCDISCMLLACSEAEITFWLSKTARHA